MSRLGALLLLSFAACNPTLNGLCTKQADCPDDTVCTDGLCLPRDPPASGDGGTVTPPDGGSTAVASVEIISPSSGDVVGGVSLVVRVRAEAASNIENVDVQLHGAGVDQSSTAHASATSGEFEAVQNLGAGAISTGVYDLVAHLRAGTTDVTSAPVTIQVDRSGPEISVRAIPYPQRTPGHPAAGAFLRNETVILEATIADAPAGLATSAPTLEAEGLSPVAGTPRGGGVFRFTFPASSPTFRRFAGELPVRLKAIDRVGNASTYEANVQLSRHAWRWEKPGNGRISAAPVLFTDRTLSAPLVVVGATDGVVAALRRTDGTTAWQRTLDGRVVGHLTSGDSTVYATTEQGRVNALLATAAPLTDAARLAWRCPDGRPGDLSAFPMESGVALARTVVSASNPAEEETLVGLTQNGRLRLFRRSGFPTNANDPGTGCSRVLDLGTTVDAAVPALGLEDGTLVAFAALRAASSRQRKELRKIAIERGSDGVYRFDEVAEADVGADLLGPVALGSRRSGPFVVAVRSDGKLRAYDWDLASIWSPSQDVLTGTLGASPALDGSFGFVVSENGDAQKFSLDDGRKQWTPAFAGDPRSSDAAAGPVLARDGRTYHAHGSRLSVLGATGTEEWSFTAAGAVVDTVTPLLACDGVLFAVENEQSAAAVDALLTDSPGPSTEGWPRPGHDVRNTFNATTPLTCAD